MTETTFTKAYDGTHSCAIFDGIQRGFFKAKGYTPGSPVGKNSSQSHSFQADS
jgi:hypothetical protein